MYIWVFYCKVRIDKQNLEAKRMFHFFIFLFQTTAPLYDASLMKNNVSLYTGGHDILADPKDVKDLIKKLPNIYRHTDITIYEHLDFIWAIEANRQCYDDIIMTILSQKNH